MSGRGAGITADQFLEAEDKRGRAYAAFLEFFERFDFLVTPSASILPFSNTQTEVLEIDGRPLSIPIEYLAITFIISLVGMPCLSLLADKLRQGSLSVSKSLRLRTTRPVARLRPHA